MQESLDIRFKQFISQLPGSEVIDDLNLPSDFDDEKRADYLVENRKVVIEMKSLISDPEYKIHDELENHQERDEYPLFYGEMELYKILKHLPDGEEINKKLYYKISRSIEKSFRKANKQIATTKELLDCSNSYGLLVLLNEGIDVLSPEIIAYRVSELLKKTDNDKQFHYKDITSVWLILENYSLKTTEGSKLLPSILIEGPGAVEQDEFLNIIEKLQEKWASFNNVPLIKTEATRINDNTFIPLSKIEVDSKQILPRHELWRKQYRKSPYLNSLSDETVLNHGARLLKLMTPHFLKGGQKIPFDKMTEFMEGWTHFLEEVSLRGIDLKDLKKLIA